VGPPARTEGQQLTMARQLTPAGEAVTPPSWSHLHRWPSNLGCRGA